MREPFLVLIVDDEEPLTEVLTMLVEDNGYTAMSANQGEAALQLTAERWPAVVLTDVMMPRMDGPQLLAHLRDTAEAQGLPMPRIIVMSAVTQAIAESLHVDAVVAKPFDLDAIEKLLKSYLGNPPPPS